MAETDFTNPKYYNNRELSWILFNHRVLSEARDKGNPLFERLKFLSITASNLDEFFMVRVASLKDMVNAGYNKKDIAGMTPQEQLEKMAHMFHIACGGKKGAAKVLMEADFLNIYQMANH